MEIALQIECLNQGNSTQNGLDVEICEIAVLNVCSVERRDWFWQRL